MLVKWNNHIRYVITNESVNLEETRPSGLWNQSSKDIEYVEEKIRKKASRLSFRHEVSFLSKELYCRIHQIQMII